jgi:hypothetical protein
MSRLMAFLQTTVADLSEWAHPSKKEDVPTLGRYQVDYSEPTQAQIDAANASCAEMFKTGEWISVNRKS